MTGHTPGPWHRNIPPASHYPTIFAGRSTHVCTLSQRDADEMEANANLVKSAPDLLAALVKVEQQLTACGRAFYGKGKRSALQEALTGWVDTAESARAVISKATATEVH